MPMPHPLAIIDESTFVPVTVEQAVQLYDALVDVGVSVAQARGLVTWLMVTADRPRAEDPTSNRVRSDYRQALLKLGVPPWEPNGDMGAYLRSRAVKKRLRRPKGRPSQRPWYACLNRLAA